MSAKAPKAERKGTKHPFAMLVLAPFSFAFTGPSVRLSAPSAGVSKVSMNLFDNFGRTDGVSKVSMPRPEGAQQPRCCRRQAHGRPGCHCRRRALPLLPPACPHTNHRCRAETLGSNMPNPLRSVQDGKDDFQARRAPRTRSRSGVGPVLGVSGFG